MSPERRMKNSFFKNPILCSKCNGDLLFQKTSLAYVCENYHKSKELSKCHNCKSEFTLCMTCWELFQTRQSRSIDESQTINSTASHKLYFGCSVKAILLVILGLVFLLLSVFLYNGPITSEDPNLKIINKLKKRYPSQKSDTWYHFVSVLEKEIPTVKSILFLHGEDERTSEYLTNELASIYTKNGSIKSEEITFNTFEHEVKDYGIILEHYRQIVRRFGIFITDLNKVNGNIARIFQSLCDEVSSDIKPSLFIFTLKYNKKTEDLKPAERATTILKEAWNDLPENERFPLLSRIVKNVIDIIPEKKNIL